MTERTDVKPTTRSAQREATRERIVQTAVDVLITRGLAATTTVEVQRQAGLSRGALLHHFPTREAMLGATIRTLMQHNEAAVHEAKAEVSEYTDAIDRAIRVLHTAVVRPAFIAELELWSAARTDAKLRDVLRREEQLARGDLYRVVADAFGPELVESPRYPMVASLTVQMLRGFAISEVLRGEQDRGESITQNWTAVVRAILADQSL